MALCSATQGAMWTINLLKELGIDFCGTGGDRAVTIHCDNKSAIAMGNNDVMHNRSKHIDIKYHFIREQIQKGTIMINWISNTQQVADILTKTLLPKLFRQFRNQLVQEKENNEQQQ